jgi:hypothetical protein
MTDMQSRVPARPTYHLQPLTLSLWPTRQGFAPICRRPGFALAAHTHALDRPRHAKLTAPTSLSATRTLPRMPFHVASVVPRLGSCDVPLLSKHG